MKIRGVGQRTPPCASLKELSLADRRKVERWRAPILGKGGSGFLNVMAAGPAPYQMLQKTEPPLNLVSPIWCWLLLLQPAKP